jgi:hypothetical protein
MAKILLNTLTRDKWKKISSPVLAQVPWYRARGPAVGRKLDAWHKARAGTAKLRKAIGGPDYAWSSVDQAKLQQAFRALRELYDALRQIRGKARFQLKADAKELDLQKKNGQASRATVSLEEERHAKLLKLTKMLDLMYREADKKVGQWSEAVDLYEDLREAANREATLRDISRKIGVT